MNNAIEKALVTWYPEDHPLHFDPLHPAIGLAGEAGELLDLYKKERFKDGVSWWDCVKCKASKLAHKTPTMLGVDGDGVPYYACDYYTPKILDELGDLWYYLRILAYQFGIRDFEKLADNLETSVYEMTSQKKEVLNILIYLSFRATSTLRSTEYHWGDAVTKENLFFVYIGLLRILNHLDCTLDQLTELNWQKLKDGDNNGWQSTRTLG